jgi:hypothetical protein
MNFINSIKRGSQQIAKNANPNSSIRPDPGRGIPIETMGNSGRRIPAGTETSAAILDYHAHIMHTYCDPARHSMAAAAVKQDVVRR